MSHPADRNLSLLHRFQQRCLCLRWRPVDFVGENDVRKQRPFHKPSLSLPRALVFFDDLSSGNVRWHQVRGELNSAKTQIHGLRQRADHQGFCKPWNPFEQTVASSKNADEQLLNHILLTHDGFRKLGDDLFASALQTVQVRLSLIG